MQVAKITLWDGRTFYTDDYERLKQFFDNVRAKYAAVAPAGARNQVDLIEMTPEEYASIPALLWGFPAGWGAADARIMLRRTSTAAATKA
jgi:hypothetical protein